jgi:hypothetical protein
VHKAVGQKSSNDQVSRLMTKRHLIITTIILTFQTFTALGQECKKFGDGEYFFKHKTKEHRQADFRLIIKGDTFTIIHDGQEKSNGTIEWWPDNCLFQLKGDQNLKTENADSLNNVQKALLSLGDSCYELDKKQNFRLTYCGNLHITKSEGRIIKKGK